MFGDDILEVREQFLPQKTLFYDVHTRRLHGMLHNAEWLQVGVAWWRHTTI